jgi:hypothetical protein
MAEVDSPDRAALVAAYKSYLRDCIDRRPSGLRQRLAVALDKHKSFISQITSTGYSVPIPAGDVTTILEVCHLSPEERRAFLALYRRAHPRQAPGAGNGPAPHRIHIDLPAFADVATALEVETLIRDFAARVTRLAQKREAKS